VLGLGLVYGLETRLEGRVSFRVRVPGTNRQPKSHPLNGTNSSFSSSSSSHAPTRIRAVSHQE